MIIIVYGLPGSGKSYFASRLAAQLDAVYVNSDELRMKLLSERTYADEEKWMVYDEMNNVMAEALAAKRPVVLDATFYKQSIRRRFEKTAKAYGEKIIYIEVTAPEELIRRRLEVPRMYSEADYEVYLTLKSTAEPLKEKHLVLESSDNNIASMLHEALMYIPTLS